MTARAARRDGSKVRLGVFVVVGILIGIAGLLAFGAFRLLERTVPLYMYFAESVQGLETGAEIKYRGVKIGRVTEIAMRPPTGGSNAMSPDAKAIIEVQGEMFPEALAAGGVPMTSPAALSDFLAKEVGRGLRVRLAWKDITGQKYLDVDYLNPADFPRPDLGFPPTEPYLPAAASPSLIDIQKNLGTAVARIAEIPFDKIGKDVERLITTLLAKLEGVDEGGLTKKIGDAADAVRDLASDPALKETRAGLNAVVKKVDELVTRADLLLSKPEIATGIDDAAAAAKSLRETSDALRSSLPGMVEKLDATLTEVQTMISRADIPATTASIRDGLEGVGAGGRSVAAMREDLRMMMREVGDAGRSISRLTQFLERHPNALLAGREQAPAKD